MMKVASALAFRESMVGENRYWGSRRITHQELL